MKPASERPQLTRLPFRALGAVAKVIESGDRKYAANDWIMAPERIDGRRDVDSALSHLAEWLGGKDVDEESGESPLAHAAARLLFLLEREARGIKAGSWRIGTSQVPLANALEPFVDFSGMTNDALADAIREASVRVKTTSPISQARDMAASHLEALQAIQVRRASIARTDDPVKSTGRGEP